MNRTLMTKYMLVVGLVSAFLFLGSFQAFAQIQGISGQTSFHFVARPGNIQTGDGDSMHMWLFEDLDDYDGNIGSQYPGPTLILQQGDTVSITLTNELPAQAGKVSMVFPGHSVTATGGVPGLLAREVAQGDATGVTYTFTATNPGTYMYHSGTRPDLQVEMGLAGAIIVRPAGYSMLAPTAYGPGTEYGHEELYFLTEMDPRIHGYVEEGRYDLINTAEYFAVSWFINGRNFPDLMADDKVPWLPSQPYNCQPQMHAQDRFLIRVVGAGRDLHPMHYHGNDFDVIAVNGRPLDTAGTSAANLRWKATTINVTAGQTADMIWTWTGKELGWDFFGHAPLPADGVARDPGDPADAAEIIDPGEIWAGSMLAGSLGATVDVTVPGGFPNLGAAGFPINQYRPTRAIVWGSAFATPDEDPNREVVQLQYDSGNTYTVTARGEEGTATGTWGAGDNVAFTDHGVPFPVIIPPRDNLSFGQFYNGSPFMGVQGDLPPSHPALNAFGGYFYMWHSHREKELTNNDIWPGGYVSFMVVQPPNVTIPEPIN